MNLSMLNCFFSVFYENRADLFEGLKVWEEKSYHKLQGRFPVIFLSFAGVKGTTFEAVLRQINYGIIEVYRRFERILDMSRKGNDRILAEYHGTWMRPRLRSPYGF